MSILKKILKPINSYINIKKEIMDTENSINKTKITINKIFASCLDRFVEIDKQLELLKKSKKDKDNFLKDEMKSELLMLDELEYATDEIISIGRNNLKLKDESKIYSKDCLQDLLEISKVVNKVGTLKKQIKQVRFEITESS